MPLKGYSISIPRHSVSLSVYLLHGVPWSRSFSFTHHGAKAKPTRPEPLGEIKAYFPQKHEDQNLAETKETYVSRWKQYVRDLSSSAVPKRLGGRSFASRVRGVKVPEVNERLGKRERTVEKQLERYGKVIDVEADDEEKGTGSSTSLGGLMPGTRR